MSQIDDYLKQVVVRNGSDLHFIAGEPPRARIYGELQILAPETLTRQQGRGGAARDHVAQVPRGLPAAGLDRFRLLPARTWPASG